MESPDLRTGASDGHSGRESELRRLHPMTLVYRFVVSLPALVLILRPALRSSDANAWLSLAMLVLYGVFIIPLIVLQYMRFRYSVTPREVIIQKGVLNTQHRSIPMERIQNIEIEQSLLPRMMGLAKVKIETAGSSSTEGVIEYVAIDEARSIRTTIRHFRSSGDGARESEAARPLRESEMPRLDSTPAEGARQTDRPGTSEPDRQQGSPVELLYEMSVGRVLLSGVFRFSLLYIVLIFSATEYLGLDPEDVARWLTGDPATKWMLWPKPSKPRPHWSSLRPFLWSASSPGSRASSRTSIAITASD
jgi:putative membrane protein